MAEGFWLWVLQLTAQRQPAASTAVGVQSRLWAAGFGVPGLQSPCSKNIYHVGVYSVSSLGGARVSDEAFRGCGNSDCRCIIMGWMFLTTFMPVD